MTMKETQTVRVTDRLRKEILAGMFGSEEPLREERLVGLYGASRTPIRSAMSTLAAEGILHYVPNCGFRVRKFGVRDVVDAYETRATLEGMACRLVAEHGLKDSDRGTLAGCIAEGQNVVEALRWTRREIDRWYACHALFHRTIVEASENEYLINGVALTHRVPFLGAPKAGPRYKEDVKIQLRPFANQERIRLSQVDHCRIFDAICGGQGTRAEHLMRELVIWNSRQYLERMERLQNEIMSQHKNATLEEA
jgi:GntR family transcriptional regulator of vanillate catabolism